MPEVADAGEDHSQTVAVGLSDDIGVSLGATGLDDGGDASLGCGGDAVRGREAATLHKVPPTISHNDKHGHVWENVQVPQSTLGICQKMTYDSIQRWVAL